MSFQDLPHEIRNHIEWCEFWQNYPEVKEPTVGDCLLADALVNAWEDGCSVAEIQAIWQHRRSLVAA
ncbi:MAG: hypothetical protein OHK0012_04890 [Synechococcales cyanobacterium]